MTTTSGRLFTACRWLVPGLLGVLTVSCTGAGTGRPVTEYLDERTGATLTRVDQPLVFYRDEPALAANVRDYIYVAPLAVNRAGEVSHWLWFGAWTTIDRGIRVREIGPREITGVQLIVDGEPIEVDVGAGRTEVPGVGNPPYATPVATAQGLFLPATASQVARLARARQLALRTLYDGDAARLWQRWDNDGAGLRAFTDTAAPAADQQGTAAPYGP